jgi:hypothetical protein
MGIAKKKLTKKESKNKKGGGFALSGWKTVNGTKYLCGKDANGTYLLDPATGAKIYGST